MSRYPLALAITEAFSIPSVEENFPSDLIPDPALNPFLSGWDSVEGGAHTVEAWEEMTRQLETDLAGIVSPSWLDQQA